MKLTIYGVIFKILTVPSVNFCEPLPVVDITQEFTHKLERACRV